MAGSSTTASVAVRLVEEDPVVVLAGAPDKIQGWLQKAHDLGLRIQQHDRCYFITRSRHLGVDGHYLYLYALDGKRGGNLRAHLAGRRRYSEDGSTYQTLKDQRLSRCELGTWIYVLAGK